MRWLKRKNPVVSKTLDHAEGATTQDLYQAAHAWTYDMYQSQTVWLNRALCALVVMTVLLGLSLLSTLLLFPLKEKVPFLYAFNNATGEITKVGELEPSRFASNWQMTRYLLIHYVMNRENYDADNIEYPYQLAWAMSDNGIRQRYEDEMSSDNPHSPYKVYGKDKFIKTRVISVNPLNDNTAVVRFEKTLTDKLSNTEQTAQKEAIIKWQYTTPETSQKMLDRDPLGFKVTYYQVSQVNLDTP